MHYLGRYTHRIAIGNSRILSMGEDTVTIKVPHISSIVCELSMCGAGTAVSGIVSGYMLIRTASCFEEVRSSAYGFLFET